MPHLGRCHHHVVVEPVGGEAHDVLVHAILYAEQRHHLGLFRGDALHECASQSALQRLVALHRRGQLTVVAGEDDAAGTTDGYPAGGLEGLGGLVDEQRAELHAVEQAVGRADECGGDDARLAEQLGVDAYLQLGGAALQAVHLLVPLVGALAL